MGLKDLEIQGDSQLVISQLQGSAQVKNPQLKALNKEAKSLLESFNSVRLTWVEREQNRQADQAANDCIDSYLERLQAEQCAETLLEAYERVAQEDGVLLGDEAFLYVKKEPEQTRPTVEKVSGGELFGAARSDGNWTIESDFLSIEDKQHILGLREPQTNVDVEEQEKNSVSNAELKKERRAIHQPQAQAY